MNLKLNDKQTLYEMYAKLRQSQYNLPADPSLYLNNAFKEYIIFQDKDKTRSHGILLNRSHIVRKII